MVKWEVFSPGKLLNMQVWHKDWHKDAQILILWVRLAVCSQERFGFQAQLAFVFDNLSTQLSLGKEHAPALTAAHQQRWSQQIKNIMSVWRNKWRDTRCEENMDQARSPRRGASPRAKHQVYNESHVRVLWMVQRCRDMKTQWHASSGLLCTMSRVRPCKHTAINPHRCIVTQNRGWEPGR